jgi:glycosyltransferase involved in cell wall biosynthesis
MACGVPVVAVAQGGPTELCVQGETALLVPPGDPRATADAVLSLLRDPERRRAMGTAGRRRAEKLFDRRQCVKALETLYDEVLAETPLRLASPAMGRGDRR